MEKTSLTDKQAKLLSTSLNSRKYTPLVGRDNTVVVSLGKRGLAVTNGNGWRRTRAGTLAVKSQATTA